jgi:hypothetical protein
VLTAILQSLYYVNGAGQLNWQRYALDYWPLLFVLIALGFHEVTSRSGQSFWKGTIVYALLLNALVVAYFKSFAWFLSAWPKLFVRHL